MEKYYCDICGKECGATKFTVPNIIENEAKGGIGNVVLWKGYEKVISEMNICNDCQNLIGCFIYGLKSNNKE